MPALDPPDRGAPWLDLALTQAQLAVLCGLAGARCNKAMPIS